MCRQISTFNNNKFRHESSVGAGYCHLSEANLLSVTNQVFLLTELRLRC